MKHTHLIVIAILFFFVAQRSLYAHGGYVTTFHGAGFNPAYSVNPQHSDYALNLAYRKGFFSYVSLYWHAEAGRLMKSKNWYGQIGADAMILFLGFQFGGMWIRQPQMRNNNAWGGYLGLSGGIPVHDHAGFFVSSGRNFMFNRRDNFYFRAGIYFGKAETR